MKRAILIVNKRSGTANADLADALARLERAGIAVTVHHPDGPEQARELILRQGAAADLVIIGGGDGTLSGCSGAVLEAGKPFGILPMGTANDFARSLTIPKDLGQAAAIIARGHTRDVDVGFVGDRPFLNVASIGFSVEVARFHRGERKRWLGILAYPLSWIDAFRAHRPFGARIICDGRTITRRCAQLAVGSGCHYGGGLLIAEDARLDDGWLRVYYVKPLGLWGWVRLLPSLWFGTLHERRESDVLRAKSVDIQTKRPRPINVDGELVARTPASFRIRHRALVVFAPPQPDDPAPEADESEGRTMTILRSDIVVALNDLVVACREAANRLNTAAESVDAGDLKDGLLSLARERESVADAIAEAVRARDDIPRAPSGELNLLDAAAMLVRSALSADETRSLIEDCETADERVAAAAAAVLDHEIDDDLRAMVRALRDGVGSAIDHLLADHPAPPSQ